MTNTVVQAVSAGSYTGEADFEGPNAITATGDSYTLQTEADGTGRRIHQVNLTGLTPGESYFYRAGDGAVNWSEVYTIKTESPERPNPLPFLTSPIPRRTI